MESILYLVVGALIGAATTYWINNKNNQEIKDALYDKQLVNKFLKEHLDKSKRNRSNKNGKKRYYKKQHASKARNKANQPSK